MECHGIVITPTRQFFVYGSPAKFNELRELIDKTNPVETVAEIAARLRRCVAKPYVMLSYEVNDYQAMVAARKGYDNAVNEGNIRELFCTPAQHLLWYPDHLG